MINLDNITSENNEEHNEKWPQIKLEESFQEIMYMIDAWINNGSGWIIESIES